MKKSTKVTYTIHIIIMAIIMAFSILGFILNEDSSIKSIYLFDLIQSVLFLTVIILTPKTMQKSSIELSDIVYIILVLFCSAHFFLGEICGFYAKIVWWDSLLHTFSGMVLSFLSFSIITLLNDTKNNNMQLSVGFSCLFAFCIAITVGVMWEIVEFTSDSLFNSNMQRAYESIAEGGSRGEPLVGQSALMDTMKDLILDSIGSIITCVLCFILCKKKNITINSLSLIKVEKKDKKNKIKKPKKKHNEIATELDLKTPLLENVDNQIKIEQNMSNDIKTKEILPVPKDIDNDLNQEIKNINNDLTQKSVEISENKDLIIPNEEFENISTKEDFNKNK